MNHSIVIFQEIREIRNQDLIYGDFDHDGFPVEIKLRERLTKTRHGNDSR